MNARRIITIVSGIATVAASLGHLIPDWAAAIGGAIAGLAINAERIMEKRRTPATKFSTFDAEERLRKLRE